MNLFSDKEECNRCSGGGFIGHSPNTEDDVCPLCRGLGLVKPENNDKVCDYCDETAEEVRTSPYMASDGMMCRECWKLTRYLALDSFEVDIGRFSSG